MVRLAAGHPDAAPAVVADAAALPFRDDAFDLVVAYMCLHDMDSMPQRWPRRPGPRAWRAAVRGRSRTRSTRPARFQGRDGDAPFLIEGSYLDAAPADWVLDRDGITLTFHSEHRPIEAYSRALEAAGLLIEAIRETRAPDAVVAAAPGQRRWQRIPLFLHLRAVKPYLSFNSAPARRAGSRTTATRTRRPARPPRSARCSGRSAAGAARC